MPENDGWKLHAAYDYRFGHMGFRVESPTGEQHFLVPMVTLFKSCRIHPDELRAFAHMMENGVKTTEGSVEPIRQQVLADTDWKGKAVLDIGGYDGFAAEIAHKGGATRAICLDNRQYDHYAAGDPGQWLDARKEGVEYITGDFMDWTDPVDTVIFFNVLYHLKNPWAALTHLRALVKPASEGLFAGALDFGKLPLTPNTLLMRVTVASGVWREGDHRDWNAIRAWADSIRPLLLQ